MGQPTWQSIYSCVVFRASMMLQWWVSNKLQASISLMSNSLFTSWATLAWFTSCCLAFMPSDLSRTQTNSVLPVTVSVGLLRLPIWYISHPATVWWAENGASKSHLSRLSVCTFALLSDAGYGPPSINKCQQPPQQGDLAFDERWPRKIISNRSCSDCN